MRTKTFGARRGAAGAKRRVRTLARAGALCLAVLLLLPSLPQTATADGSVAESPGNAAEGSYVFYIGEHGEKPKYAGEDIVIPAASYTDTNINVSVYDTYEGRDNVVLMKENSAAEEKRVSEQKEEEKSEDLAKAETAYITYNVSVPVSGLYWMGLNYFPAEGKGVTIERGLLIDGERPFAETDVIKFSRSWKNVSVPGTVFDSAGNEIRPDAAEAPEWSFGYFDGDDSYFADPFLFYLEQGEHEISLISEKEPMIIADIILRAPRALPTYAEVRADYEARGYQKGEGQFKVEAENTFRKSSASIYPYHSRASVLNSAVTGSFTYDHTQINTIGGETWSKPGDWLTWQIEVEKTGLYEISVRGRQNVNRGLSSGRTLLIDGEIPFEDAKHCAFAYEADFEMYTLGAGDGNFEFYFEAGRTYNITLKASLGTVETLARRLDAAVNELMKIYRRLLVVIGNSPDTGRDYRFDLTNPGELVALAEQEAELRSIQQGLFEMTGERDSNQAMIERAANRIERMHKKSSLIAENFKNFKSETSAIADWVRTLTRQPLELDYLLVAPAGAKLPEYKAGFFANIGHEIRLFWSSFTTDYTSVGTVSDADKAVTVWFAPGAAGQIVGGGREQAQILKTMIEDDFIYTYDIPVNLQIIDLGALLPATLAGKGPDVALQVAGGSPVQFAMRGAVYDLATFDDYEEVAKRFYPSSMVQLTYQDGVYALPETQTFPVMFYRTDIFDEMGLEVPDTWDDVYDLIPDLQNNYMNFGYPANVNNFVTFIYQRGAELYKGEGVELGYATNLDSIESIESFMAYVDLYRSYKLGFSIDFLTRFRVGEVPIGISDFTTVNTLYVSAPEIRGLWSFTLVPGTIRKDANGNEFIDRTIATGGSGCMMLAKTKRPDEAWEFMKWWTSDKSQQRYCMEVESIIGAAARIPSANKSVMGIQPWTADEYRIISAQRAWTKGVPEVPGGYYTGRHMENAFNRTYTLRVDPRETLLDYIPDINAELTKKRTEMGIPTLDDILERGGK